MANWIDALAKEALAGDEVSWKKLYQALTPRLWALFRRLGAERSEGEDLVQETWIHVFRHRDQFDETRRFEPYIFTIATHCWVDQCRRAQRAPPCHRLPEDEPNTEPLPVDWSFALERSEEVRHGLEKLSDEEKTILVLRFWQDLTIKHIAERLGAEESSIRAKSFRAMRKLAKSVQL